MNRKNLNFGDRILLISNKLARGMSVANSPQSTTWHNEARPTSTKLPRPHGVFCGNRTDGKDQEVGSFWSPAQIRWLPDVPAESTTGLFQRAGEPRRDPLDTRIFSQFSGIPGVYQSTTCSVLPTPSQAHQGTIPAHSIAVGHKYGTTLSNCGASRRGIIIGLALAQARTKSLAGRLRTDSFLASIVPSGKPRSAYRLSLAASQRESGPSAITDRGKQHYAQRQ
jgi:hypothetical protein